MSLPRPTLLLAVLLAACGPEAEPDETLTEIPGPDDGEASSAIVSSPPFYGDPANGAVFAIDISHWEGPIAQREMDCFWDSGVRHVVSGTQVEEVTRQQLAMAVSRGMTVDAYVYLYWDREMGEQVETAFVRSDGFPIDRLWLDVEEDPGDLGATRLMERIQAALAACRARGTVTCGIYTGPGFWKTYLANTTAFADAPLWYAWYNSLTSLSRWSVERFGGWSAATAKQWAEQSLCGVGVDKNTMQVFVTPQQVVDRTVPPDDGRVPPAPRELYPADGARIGIDLVKLMTETFPRALRYDLALEQWRGTSFAPYYVWSSADGFRKTYPPRDHYYRFRARARNATGIGPWSAWVTFEYGTASGPRPTSAPPPPDPPPPPPPPPSTPGVPSELSPDGVVLSGSSVTLAFAPVGGATRYEIAIEYRVSSGAFAPYVSYATTAAAKTFYPQVRGTTYRWRVHALSGGAWSSWSPWASFELR